MENAETILVIILSSALAIFIIIGIIVLVATNKLVKKLNAIADAATEVVNNVESASEVLKKAAGPLAAGKFIMNIADVVLNKKKGK